MTTALLDTRTIEKLDEEKPDMVALAELASIAVRIEPALLRAQRLALLPTADAGAEADLWFSPFIQARNSVAIIFWPALAEQLRRRLSRDQARLHRAREIVQRVHKSAARLLQLQEELIFAALTHEAPSEVAKKLYPVLGTLAQQSEKRSRNLAAWAARAIPGLPLAVCDSEEFQLLGQAADIQLGTSSLGSRSGAESLSPRLRWLLPRVDEVSIGWQRQGEIIVLNCPQSESSSMLRLPRTAPLLLEVTTSQGSHIVRFASNERISVGVGSGDMILRTALGRLYREQPLPTHEQLRRLMHRLLPTSEDFEALCLDYFPQVHAHFTLEMSRSAREYVLLESIGRAEIWAALQDNTPRASRALQTLDSGNSLVAEPFHSDTPQTVSNADLRRMLYEFFPVDSEFDAFLLDFFMDTYREVSRMMSREQKVTFLLRKVTPAQILGALSQLFPNGLHTSGDAAPSLSLPVPAQLREILMTAFKDDADIDAFCVDFYPQIFSDLSLSLKRSEKVALLVESMDAAELWSAVLTRFPQAATAAQRLLLRPTGDSSESGLSRASVRSLLYVLQSELPQLVSFLFDQFPQLARKANQFDSNLQTIISVLLTQYSPETIVQVLRQHFPEHLIRHAGVLDGNAAAGSTAEGVAPEGPIWTRRSVRSFLHHCLVIDSDLTAFCVDYFPEVQMEFTSAMDRVQRISCLLEMVDPRQLVAQLRRAEPQRSERFQSLLQPESPPWGSEPVWDASLPHQDKSIVDLFMRVLPLVADFDAFCLDYFPEVRRKFTREMDRTKQVLMLLEQQGEELVLARLREAEPQGFHRYQHVLVPEKGLGPSESILAALREESREIERLIVEEVSRKLETREVDSNDFPSDNQTAIVNHAGEVDRVLPDYAEAEDFGGGEFRIPMTVEFTGADASLFVDKGTYWSLSAGEREVFPVSNSDHNRHYVEASAVLDLSVDVIARVELEQDEFETLRIAAVDVESIEEVRVQPIEIPDIDEEPEEVDDLDERYDLNEPEEEG